MQTIIAAGGLVFNAANELLMIYRRGKWDLPKGKLDEGETIEACALREVEEETGVSPLNLGELVDITTHEYFDKWLNANVFKRTHWYRMKTSFKEQLIPQAEEDIEKVEWVAIKDIPEKLNNSYPNIVTAIQKALKSGF